MRKFILNDVAEKFEEVEDYIPKTALFKPDNVVLFISDIQKTAWIWIGSKTTQKQRFLAPYKAVDIRNMYGFYYSIKTAEQGDEPIAFQMMVGAISMEISRSAFREIHIVKLDDGINLIDNRGNVIFVSEDYIPKFKEMVEEIGEQAP